MVLSTSTSSRQEQKHAFRLSHAASRISLRKPFVLVIFLMTLSAQLLQAQDCLDDDALYVTPEGVGMGTRLSPAGLLTALAICESDTSRHLIKLGTGTYAIDRTLYIPSGVTIDGNYDVTNGIWKKSKTGYCVLSISPPGEEVKTTTSDNKPVVVGHYIGIRLDTVSNITLKDFTLEVHKRNNFWEDMISYGDRYGDGKSIYAIFGRGSENIYLINLHIVTDSGGEGLYGYQGRNGAEAYYYVPGKTVYDPSLTVYQQRPSEELKQSYEFRAGGDGGAGGRIQDYYRCLDCPSTVTSASTSCAAEYPLPKGGRGGKNGGLGGEAGDNCEMDCYYEYYKSKVNLTGELLSLLSLPSIGGEQKDPTPDPGDDGQDGTNNYNGGDYTDQTIYPYDDINYYYIPGYGANGGDGSGGSGGGGGGAGGIRTLGLVPQIPGMGDYNLPAKALGVFNKAITLIGGDDVCHAEIVNGSTEGGRGGAGGEGGEGGGGGHGGGASIGIFMPMCKNVVDKNCVYTIGEGGGGGFGGYGGKGGDGGLGMMGRPVNDGGWSYQGAKGGKGGKGGDGSRGQHGSNGRSIAKIGVAGKPGGFVMANVSTACSNSVITLYTSGDKDGFLIGKHVGTQYNKVNFVNDKPTGTTFTQYMSEVQITEPDTGRLEVYYITPGAYPYPQPDVHIKTIRPLPAFHVPAVLCQGDTLKASTSETSAFYLWKVFDANETVVYSSDKKSISFFPAGNGTYTVGFQAYDMCCGYSAPQYKTVRVSSVSKPAIEKTNNGLWYCYGSDSSKYDVISPVNVTDQFRWSNGSTSKMTYMKAAGWYYVTRTNADGCSAKSDSIRNYVFSLPQNRPAIQDITGICNGTEITLTPDYEAGMLYRFYYQGTSKTGGFLNDGSPQQSLTFKPTIPFAAASASYYVRKVNTNYQNGHPIYCASDDVQEVRLYRETAPPVIISDNVKRDLAADNGTCQAFYIYDYPKAIDNCNPYVSVKIRHMPANHYYPVGTTVDTLRYTDVSGNFLDYPIAITVHDVAPPIIASRPANYKELTSEPGACGAYYAFTLAQALDKCTTMPVLTGAIPEMITLQGQGYADVFMISGSQTDSVFQVGNNVIRQTWTDAAGNTTTFEQNIVVKDSETPKLQATDITYYVARDKSTASTGYNAPLATDNCTTVLTSTFVSGFGQSGEHPIGTTTEVWKATDESGNAGFASFKLTVLDTISPSIDCRNIRPAAYAVPGTDSALVTFATPVALDNSGSVTVTTQGKGSGSYFKLGIYPLTYVAKDPSGNSASCVIQVAVSDFEAPAIVCPADITVANDPGLCGAVVNFAMADAHDNDGSDYTPYRVIGLASGAVFPIGTTLQVFKVADANGNIATCGFNVTVTDTEAPQFIACPPSRTEFVNPAICGTMITLSVPVATDNSCFSPTTGFVSGSAGGFFPVGVTHQVYAARDAYGNTATCAFDVTVIDNTTLTVTCPSNVEINTTPGLCGAVLSTRFPEASNFYGCLQWELVSAKGIGDMFVPGPHTVTYRATAFGQSATCSFNVNVIDVVGPKIVQPDNIVVSLDNGACGKEVTFPEPVVMDNCTNFFLQRTAGLPSGSVFPVGTTVQKYIAFDNTHTDAVTFTITVLDNTAPAFTGVPDITETTSDICGKVINFATPVATDNSSCLTVTRLKGLNSGDLFPVGTTTQVYVAKDGAGNTDTTRFNIVVNSGPQTQYYSCPPDVVVMSDNDLTKVVWYDVPGRTSCAGVTAVLISGKGSGATFPAGKTTETYLITDASGKTDTCQFNVFVAEKMPPNVMCQPYKFDLDDAICGARVKLPVPQVDDWGGSGLQTIFNDIGPIDSAVFLPVGYSTVMWTAIDNSGNRGYCFSQVTVGKEESPLNGFSHRVEFCEGSDVEINPRMSGTGPYVYEWSYYNPTTFEMVVLSTDSIFRIPHVKESDERQYMYVVKSPCNNDIFRREFFLQINPSPQVTLSGLNAGYCEYDLSGKPLTYSPAGGVLVGDGLVDGKFYPSKAGIGTHTFSYVYHDDALGCPATASLTTEVHVTPVVEAFIDTAYCINNPVLKLDATNSVYTGPGISGTTFNAALAQAGTHTITRSITVDGCVNSAAQIVRIQGNVPDATILTGGAICSNKGRVKLEAVTTGGTWSGEKVYIENNIPYFNVNAAVLGEHKVYHEMVDGICVSTDSATVDIIDSEYNLPFTFNAYCYDQGLVPMDVSGGKNYFGYGIDKNMFNPAAYDTTTTALFGISTVNARGCIDTVWRAMAVLKPEIIDPLKLICKKGDPTLLSVDSKLASATWFDTTTGYTKTVYDSGSYIVELRNTSGCVKVDTFRVESKQASLPALINNTDQLYKCIDAMATLTASGNYVSQVWSTGEQGRTITVSSPGEYKVYVTDSVGCELADSIRVEDYPRMENNQLTNKGTYLEAVASTSYTWYKDGLPIDGASGQILPFPESGSYYVELADNNGCLSASDVLQVVVTSTDGEGKDWKCLIYPNPGTGKYQFEFTAKPSYDLDIVFINALGQTVQQLQINSRSDQAIYYAHLEAQPAGVYWALIKQKDRTTVVKLVKVD